MPSELYFKMVYQNASKQCARVWSAIEKIDYTLSLHDALPIDRKSVV